ncbi:MAG: glycoside hydrolase family 127 protein [Bacteroidales bacterium]|nr:glycoside hydrolase family 127 protein [Bacteroidales bacterium]
MPGWAEDIAIPGPLYNFSDEQEAGISLTVNGKTERISKENGYALINRKWEEGDKIILNMPMEVRTVTADERLEADRGRFAVQRGPMVYAAEWADNDGGVLNLVFNPDQEMIIEERPDMLDGTVVIKAEARPASKKLDSTVELGEKRDVTLIPYHLWNNRGPGEMMVWLPAEPEAVKATHHQLP